MLKLWLLPERIHEIVWRSHAPTHSAEDCSDGIKHLSACVAAAACIADAWSEGASTAVFDAVARYGGEEFVVLLPHTDTAGAQVIAVLLPEGATFSTPAALINAADNALYKTKSAGRGHITVHNPDIP